MDNPSPKTAQFKDLSYKIFFEEMLSIFFKYLPGPLIVDIDYVINWKLLSLPAVLSYSSLYCSLNKPSKIVIKIALS